MKIGDKLLCIESSKYQLLETSGITHIKDKSYTIFGFTTKSGNFIDVKGTTIIEKNAKSIYVEVETDSLSYLHSFFRNPDPNKEGYNFTIEPSKHMFSEHFTTLQNYRKQKLRKINREYHNNNL